MLGSCVYRTLSSMGATSAKAHDREKFVKRHPAAWAFRTAAYLVYTSHIVITIHFYGCSGLSVLCVFVYRYSVRLRQDYLKDTKACLTNDFSRYKRALTSVRQELPDADELAQV